MSNITENTIVVKTSENEKFVNEFNEFSNEFRLCNLNSCYKDENIQVYVFDCNGDNPWYQGIAKANYLINEINYGKGYGGPLTEIRCKDGLVRESRFHCVYHLKKLQKELGTLPIEEIKKKISYTF